jgi:hypothetical protein
VILQDTDVPTDGAARDVEFLGGRREAQRAGDGFEYGKGLERGQTHYRFFSWVMSIHHFT